MNNILLRLGVPGVVQKTLRILLCVAAVVLLFSFYTWGNSQNPPGFQVDESATAYNAYLVSRTGAGEFGPRFPVMFQQYAVSSPTYMNPLAIYLLACTFRFLPPSIPVARTFAAFWMFAACLLLGALATRISGQRKIGIIVAGSALLTPWLFEEGRLVFDAHLPAFTIVVFVRCYLQDQSLTPLLMTGDGHWPHHVEGSGGAILFATFILAMAGLLLVIARRWHEPWWRFVLYGLAVSILPGAITDWPFHQPRLMGYAVFLLVLTVPALDWLLAPDEQKQGARSTDEQAHGSEPDRATVVGYGLGRPIRLGIVGILLAATLLQFIDFQITFWREG